MLTFLLYFEHSYICNCQPCLCLLIYFFFEVHENMFCVDISLAVLQRTHFRFAKSSEKIRYRKLSPHSAVSMPTKNDS